MTAPAIVKVALAGIGGYGDHYLEAFLPREGSLDAKLVGVVDPLPQRCKHLADLRSRGVPIHPSVQSLFADVKPDLLMIATPIHLHAPQTCFALQRGTNVLCEKPLAGTMADAVRMWHVQLSAKAFAAIGYQWSFSEAVQSLKADIMSGVLGKAVRMKSIVFLPRPQSYFRRNDWAGRIRTTDGDGVLDSPVNNATSHFLHNMFYLLGRTRETSAMPQSVQAELYRANQIENYDTAAIRSRTECGTEILFYTTHAAPDRRGPKSHFEFEKAIVEFDANGSGQFIAHFHDGRSKSYGHPNLDRHEKIWQSIDSVRTGKPVACGIPAAMAHTLCVAAAQESAPIINFPSRLKRMLPYDGNDAIVFVDGLAEALSECYEQGTLPSESGCLDWPREGVTVDLQQPQWARHRTAPAQHDRVAVQL